MAATPTHDTSADLGALRRRVLDSGPARRLRSVTPRQWKAIVAGGGITALGTSIAFAAWSDQAFVNRDINTGGFDIEVSVDGSTWADYNTSPGGALTVSAGGDFAGMTPGDTVYSLVRLRQKDQENLPASIILRGLAPSGAAELLSTLTYSARAEIGESATCTAANFANNVGTPLVTNASFDVVSADEITVQPDETLNVCFAVSMASGATSAAQNKSANVAWRFDATSA